MTPNIRWLAVISMVVLTACSGGNEDLQQFVNDTKAKPTGKVHPIPVFKPYQAFTYSAQALRPPFEKPVDILALQKRRGDTSIKPDFSRPKEFLEGFDLDNLAMVGTLSNSKGFWALVRDTKSNVHRVAMNNYMGRNHGKVIELGDTFISLIEIVPDGLGGWLERPKTLNLKVLEN
jgi:type IV pilus assembly protein PilP